MSTDDADAPPAPVPPDPPRRRGHPLIAWVVIVAAVAGLFVLRLLFRPPAEGRQLDAFELQARFLVGAARLGAKPADVYNQDVKDLDRGPASQRLRFAVLAGELGGPAEALARLADLKDLEARGEVAHTERDDAVADLLARLYHDYEADALSAPALSDEDRQELRRRLGWFGELALNPARGPNPAARAAVLAPARRGVIGGGLLVLAGVSGGLVGFVLLILFAAQWRQMRGRFIVGSPYGGVYAETFALWMVLFVGLSLAGVLIPKNDSQELLSGLLALCSLSALAWPVLRGASWRQVRQDIGWRAGDQPALEPFFGIVCYLAALPVVLFNMALLMLVLRAGQKWGGHTLFSPEESPSHPIEGFVLHASWWGWVQAVFLASVVAPFLEETMFRGVLYRHLREATSGLTRAASIVFSALTASFVFAALHPQGILAVPLLMALACGFTAAREWRGSLVPSMTVHALHNGALLLVLILVAGY